MILNVEQTAERWPYHLMLYEYMVTKLQAAQQPTASCQKPTALPLRQACNADYKILAKAATTTL